MKKKIKTRAVVFIILMINILLIYFWLFFNISNNLEVIFLDVGQGDSVLIKTPFGQNILIDGGPGSKVINELNEELAWFDRFIDLVIVTHPDNDHIGGLIPVLERFAVGKVIYTGVMHESPVYDEFKVILKEKDVDVNIINGPEEIKFGKNCNLNIIFPVRSFVGLGVDVVNNSSIVAMLNCAQKKFLLAGDIEEEVESELVEKGLELSADVYKASHHGSDTSNIQSFLELVKPEIVVIQVGADNTFGHPSLRVIKRFERVGAKVYRNDLDGVIRFEVVEGELELVE